MMRTGKSRGLESCDAKKFGVDTDETSAWLAKGGLL